MSIGVLSRAGPVFALILVKVQIPLGIKDMCLVGAACPQGWPQLVWVTGSQCGAGGIISLPSRLSRIETSEVLSDASSFSAESAACDSARSSVDNSGAICFSLGGVGMCNSTERG